MYIYIYIIHQVKNPAPIGYLDGWVKPLPWWLRSQATPFLLHPFEAPRMPVGDGDFSCCELGFLDANWEGMNPRREKRDDYGVIVRLTMP